MHKTIYAILILFLIILTVSCSKRESLIRKFQFEPIEKTELAENFRNSNFKKVNDLISVQYPNAVSVDLYDLNLDLILSFGQKGRGPGEFSEVTNLLYNKNGYFVHDMESKTISKFDLKGTFLSSQVYSDLVMSFAVDDFDNIYQGVMGYDRLSVKKAAFNNFQASTTLFAKTVRDLSESSHELNLLNNILLVNRIFTNETILLALDGTISKVFTNPYIEDSSEFKSDGNFKIPLRPVWRSNTIIDDKIFQLRNIPDSKSEIYRSDFDGNIDAMITFDHYTTSFFEMEEEVWMFSPDSLYKYAKSSFFN